MGDGLGNSLASDFGDAKPSVEENGVWSCQQRAIIQL
jgi:hypothetical protein